jgi:hypothetical protein
MPEACLSVSGVTRGKSCCTALDPLLKAVAPYRDSLVVAVACLFTWDWRAARCAPEGLPLVLGHALDMKALHGSHAKHDHLDAHKSAALRQP